MPGTNLSGQTHGALDAHPAIRVRLHDRRPETRKVPVWAGWRTSRLNRAHKPSNHLCAPGADTSQTLLWPPATSQWLAGGVIYGNVRGLAPAQPDASRLDQIRIWETSETPLEPPDSRDSSARPLSGSYRHYEALYRSMPSLGLRLLSALRASS